MTCHVVCDACSLDETFEDCVTAHETALDHEQSHPDHFVSLRNPA
jgi:hypothetical protein